MSQIDITKQEADSLILFLESVTELAWWKLCSKSFTDQHDIEAVVAAWKKIEGISGVSGTVPNVSDFFSTEIQKPKATQ